jgi:hypothetical protein
MQTFLISLLLLFGLSFVAMGIAIFVRAKNVIQAIQKRKFGKIAEPRKQEILFARILAILFVAIGVYYSYAAIVAFFL